MNALAWIRRHAAAVWLATCALIALGVAGAYAMPSGIYPEVDFPRIVVVARSAATPPDVFLTTITGPLEQTLTTVVGVQRVRSKTIRGATEISLDFAPGTDLWRALQMVESRANELRSSLPPGVELTVERVTTASFPVVTFNVAGVADPRELRELAEYQVRPVLAGIPGVGRIEILGGDVREFEVILDPEALAALHLSAAEVANRLRAGMGLSAVGRVEQDAQYVTVTATAQPKTLADIRAVPVMTTSNGAIVTVGSIAEVVEGAEDRGARVGGELGETVSLSVARLPGASTPDVVERAVAAVSALGPTLPAGVTIRPVYDQATLVRDAMNSVRDAILLGIALCVGVLALFLRDARAGLLTAVSVPITLAISLGVMHVAGQTLNLMSLGGLAVAIGLVVDDAIVMVEAIARQRDLGADPATAAARGTIELAPAVIGTTLTTVVVFVPLAFLQGVVGDFFRSLAFTLTTAVLVSLAVALVLVPLAASQGLTAAARPTASRLPLAYGRFVRRIVRRPGLAGAAFVAILLAGGLIAPRVERGFLPTMDEGAFVLDYFLPAGTSLEATEGYARRIEAELKKTPEVRAYTRRTGAELGPAAATELNRGDIMVRLSPPSQRNDTSEDIIADLRTRIQRDAPEVRVEFVQVLQDVLNDLAGNPRPIEVKLFGPDYAKLHEIGDVLVPQLRKLDGLVDLYDGHERDLPELKFAIRRDALARLGVTPEQATAELDTALLGTVVGNVRRYDRLVGVRVRFPNPIRWDRQRVLDLPLAAGGHTTSFRAAADIESTTGPSSLLHEALEPLVSVTADQEGGDLGALADQVEDIARSLPLPPGYRVEVGGQIESQRQTLRQLAGVGAVAVLLVLTLLAAQFRRLRMAVLVLSSVPIAMVGALLALLVTGTPLNASSLIGAVLLVGLVVKNGVLLLEEAEEIAEAGTRPVDAVTQASERRVRPVLMTTLATLAGLLPLAFGIGAGAELQRPLALAVIGGLLTSTIATLGLLPPFAALALRRRRATSAIACPSAAD